MKRYSFVTLDMDGTIVNYPEGQFGSSWDAIGYNTPYKKEWIQLLEDYYPRSKDNDVYTEWGQKNCELLKGLPVVPILNNIFPVKYVNGVKETVEELHKREKKVGLLSGGVDLVCERVVEETGMDFYYCNRVFVKDNVFTGKGDIRVKLWNKDKIFREICNSYDVPLEEAVHVGDHVNDIPVFEIAGLGIAFNPKSKNVKRSADVVIESDDLRDILPHIN